jgi:hypothetical protein
MTDAPKPRHPVILLAKRSLDCSLTGARLVRIRRSEACSSVVELTAVPSDTPLSVVNELTGKGTEQ